MVHFDLFCAPRRLITQPRDGANAARLDYDLVRSAIFHSQPVAPTAAWLILFLLGLWTFHMRSRELRR